MGLTSSLFTGLSGLNANSQLMTVTGNNIANVNTTGFKTSRLDFETQISETLQSGTAPSANSGGTNPIQVGLGTRIAGASRDFANGSLQPTGVNSDLAITGSGFFILNFGGANKYTRDGTFKLDQNFNLVNSGGGKVQGYGVNSQFDIAQGVLTDLQIPIGALTLAEPTKNVHLTGNLNAGGNAATVGSVNATDELHSAASSAAGANDAVAGTALTSLYATGSATPLFAAGDVITVTGATRGGASLPDRTFQVGPANTTGSDANGTTVQSFMTFLQSILGIDTSAGAGPGVAIAGGQIAVTGNTGTVNDLLISSGNIVNNKGTAPTQPFTMTKAQSADGESVRTTFVVYDSLGLSVPIDLSVVLESKGNSGTTWRFYEQSRGNSGLSPVLGNGVLTFDTNGQMISATNTTENLNRAGTGALTPQPIALTFSDPAGSVSALSDVTSQVTSLSQDGSPIGTLQDFTVDQSGIIVGTFSNSLKRNLGQVALATFTNPQGLVESGNNLYTDSINSGSPALATPGTGAAGHMVGGAVEQSNVDLSREFINLISASTGFSANSRVLTTSDRLIQDLLQAIR
jgi:flagellar hook protein FlgE